MRLQQVQTTVQNADIVAADTFLKHFRNEAVRHVKLSLRPAFALVPRLLERKRFFIVNNSVMRPCRLNAFHQRFHGEFHIFREACCTPAVSFQHVRRNTHARTAEHRGKTDIRLRQMPDMVNNPKSNGKRTGNPCIVRIFGIKITLNEFVALTQAVVHLQQKAFVH